jgi:hypothetical protein
MSDKKSPFAYVTFLNESLIVAMVFGYSVKCTHTSYDSIIMVRSNTPSSDIRILRTVYTKIIEITNDVSFQLNALKLTSYEKILLCDPKTIITSNIDHLFETPAPAGSLKDLDYWDGLKGKRTGEKIDFNLINQLTELDLGILLLIPNEKQYDEIKSELKKNKINFANYLLKHNEWYHLGVEYNARSDYLDPELLKNGKFYLIRYESENQPWNFLRTHPNVNNENKDLHISLKLKFKIWFEVFKTINEKLKKKNIDLLKLDKKEN